MQDKMYCSYDVRNKQQIIKNSTCVSKNITLSFVIDISIPVVSFILRSCKYILWYYLKDCLSLYVFSDWHILNHNLLFYTTLPLCNKAKNLLMESRYVKNIIKKITAKNVQSESKA